MDAIAPEPEEVKKEPEPEPAPPPPPPKKKPVVVRIMAGCFDSKTKEWVHFDQEVRLREPLLVLNINLKEGKPQVSADDREGVLIWDMIRQKIEAAQEEAKGADGYFNCFQMRIPENGNEFEWHHVKSILANLFMPKGVEMCQESASGKWFHLASSLFQIGQQLPWLAPEVSLGVFHYDDKTQVNIFDLFGKRTPSGLFACPVQLVYFRPRMDDYVSPK